MQKIVRNLERIVQLILQAGACREIIIPFLRGAVKIALSDNPFEGEVHWQSFALEEYPLKSAASIPDPFINQSVCIVALVALSCLGIDGGLRPTFEQAHAIERAIAPHGQSTLSVPGDATRSKAKATVIRQKCRFQVQTKVERERLVRL